MNVTPLDYLKIDICNLLNTDKINLDERIEWVNSHSIEQLEAIAVNLDEDKFQAIKAVNAYRKHLQGLPVKHTMGMDACASGIQMFGVLMGDYNALGVTGLLPQCDREDAYKHVIDVMNKSLRPEHQIGSEKGVTRKDAKNAIMTFLYGSFAEPYEVFGAKLYQLFVTTMESLFPKAMMLYNVLKDSWDSTKDYYEWVLPNRHVVEMPVMQKVEADFAVEILGGAMFTHRWDKQMPMEESVKLVANVIHSIDGYVANEMVFRASVSRDLLKQAREYIVLYIDSLPISGSGLAFANYMDDYPVCVSNITDLQGLCNRSSINHLRKLCEELDRLIPLEPFHMQTVHDSFRAHPVHMQKVRDNYKHILAQIADSNFQNVILRQLCGGEIQGFEKQNFSEQILQSEYGLS